VGEASCRDQSALESLARSHLEGAPASSSSEQSPSTGKMLRHLQSSAMVRWGPFANRLRRELTGAAPRVSYCG
jgi:hypothetical protein